ncbi:MAG: cupin domain-containing protein [Deltaproteobacteria bacterium]|nr:cupin domain-containing protein [Deltaproteobacteria bacterium]
MKASGITVSRPTAEELAQLSVDSWGSWSCEASTFDWQYDERETAYIQAGDVTVRAADGEETRFGAGDLVVFPAGLKCSWVVDRAVQKLFRLG